ncbi:hypothetical protein UDOIXSUF_CDS0065 [Staphylococcus phage PG-2021_1]|jgi:hypothetical protein|uniref:Uncharacterized protein n=3 Tax=unclassified Sepunavirus TaxID=2315193 RepID=A0AAX3Y2A0_9CAUD|nr:hypothetical protein Terranova_008 [Staphylococcus phage Terranova]QLF86742.1 hypothetical protein BESEP4_00008 [Staphylococcus phage vB_SepM_BE04]WJJ57918.1 hypothetical protein 80A_00139 [Staphylococcus phage 80A]WJJ58112.1 hypothetical protein 80B_00140 [Staphylococcus phage 80B]WJJ58307.1 hypothetical protein 110_00144 [Staphylococcus phage 110]
MEFNSLDLANYIDKYGRVNDEGIKTIDLGKGYEIQYLEPIIFSNHLLFCKNRKEVLKVALDNTVEVTCLDKNILIYPNVFNLIDDLYEECTKKESEEERRQRKVESKVKDFLGGL